MKVLHVLDHSLPIQSGYSARSRSIVEFQRRLGLAPVVLTSPKHYAAQDTCEQLDGVAHYRTRPPRGAGGPPFAREILLIARMAARITAVARAEGARLIHAHSPSLNGLAALWAGRRLGVGVVYEARAFWEDAAVDHGTFREGSLRYRVSRAIETWLFRHADRVVTICEGMRRELIHRGIDGSRVAVVPNGVDAEWFSPRPRSERLSRRLGLNGGPVFGFLGSFYHYEGLRFLLEALPALRRRLPGTRVLLVGGGSEEPALRTAASGLGDAVVFTGRVPPERVREFYSLIDVFVCPRRRMRLTELVTPLKPLEAMAMARTVLASDVGGLAELIQDEITGLLFAADKQEALVDQAVRAGQNADLRSRLGARARRHVIAERTWERLVARHLRIYEELSR